MQTDLFAESKVCRSCNQRLPETDFAPIKAHPGRRAAKCRPCMKAYLQAWHAKRPDYAKTKSREWFAKNGKQWNESRKAHLAAPLKITIESERKKIVETLQSTSPAEKPAPYSDGIPKVYFVQEGSDGPIKIGYTLSTITKRLHQLQNGNPRMLYVRGVLAGGQDMEAELHKAFSHLQIRGNKEWFQNDPELLEFVETVAVLPEPQGNKTGFRGVFSSNKGRQFSARVRTGTDSIYLGCYPTAEEAALAYDNKARELFGAKAPLI